ncbi:glutamate--cysteine ligase, partial [Xanthomonas sp. Kuri4-2]
ALKISRDGLRRRARRNPDGQDETGFLDVIEEIARSGKTAAQRKLDLFAGRWQGEIDPLFGEFAY